MTNDGVSDQNEGDSWDVPDSSHMSHKEGAEALDAVIAYFKQNPILSEEDYTLLLSWKLKTKLYVRRFARESR